MRDFPDLPDFLRRKPNDGVIDVSFMKTRTKPMVNPNPLYSKGKYLGSYFDYKDGTFSAYLPDGKTKQFTSKADAMAWLSDGQTLDQEDGVALTSASHPKGKKLKKGFTKELFKGATEQVEVEVPKPVKAPRPAKVESPEVEEAKLKFKQMKMPEIESWGRKIGAKWEPVAPNPGVLRMRVQNAILSKLREKGS